MKRDGKSRCVSPARTKRNQKRLIKNVVSLHNKRTLEVDTSKNPGLSPLWKPVYTVPFHEG